MLELKTKWMTNTIAKESIQKKDFILCHNGERLFIVGYGEVTNGGKNTYNYIIKDNAKDIVLSNGENTYLDALTKIILGTSPKAKANKEAKDNNTKAKQTNKRENEECLHLTFDEAFEKACKQIEIYKPIAIELDKYNNNDAIKLTMIILKDAQIKEKQRIKNAKKQEEIQALLVSLDIAKKQGNTMLVDALNEIIANKEKE